MTELNAIKEIEELGNRGIIVSIAYGPRSGKFYDRCKWSVSCFDNRTRGSFFKSFVANSFIHCIDIAKIEIEKRGWLE